MVLTPVAGPIFEAEIERFFLKQITSTEISINLKYSLLLNYLFLWSGFINLPLQSSSQVNQCFSRTFERLFSKISQSSYDFDVCRAWLASVTVEVDLFVKRKILNDPFLNDIPLPLLANDKQLTSNGSRDPSTSVVCQLLSEAGENPEGTDP